jgi:Raf kinase inhibitor-like YbhB/YbcL family protein
VIAPFLLAVAAATGAMQLQSGDFSPGGAVPRTLMATDCGGQNRTPSLSWKDPPTLTKSFAIIVRDPDAPIAGGFYHWVVYDLPATTRRLAGGAPLGAGQTGLSSTGRAAYYGPCPPSGPAHHYTFTLYALDIARVDGNSPLTAPQLEGHFGGHILARTTLEATAARP